MNDNKERDMLDTARQGQGMPEQTPPGLPTLIDTDMLQDFTELFGPEQARNWLDEFQAGLIAEITRSVEEGDDPKRRRDSIHHLCGRAGFIGFPALHAACMDYLEASPSNGAAHSAFENVRVQARLVCAEIDTLRVGTH